VPTRIYDYNYRCGESYYSPQTDYISDREVLRRPTQQPPEAATFAERFAAKPFYGSAHGLPYDDAQSVRNLPPPRRSVSASRGDRSRERGGGREPEEAPRLSRTPRPRERRISFKDEPDLGLSDAVKDIMNGFDDAKFSLDDDTLFNAPTRYATRKDKDDFNSAADQFLIKPHDKAEIQNKLKQIQDDFRKADEMHRGRSLPRTVDWTANGDDIELSIPQRRSSVKLPKSGKKLHTSKKEITIESLKPPKGPRTTVQKKISISHTDEDDFKLPPLPRSRRQSVSEMEDVAKFMDDERRFRNARELRKERKAQESKELTDNINRMIKKINLGQHTNGNTVKEAHDVHVIRTARAKSLEPFAVRHTPIVGARPSVKAQNFVYGYCR